MSHSREDEYNEMILYVSELRRKFNSKLDDQLFLIEQQRNRIEYQQQQIDDQRIIIEELAWQIRDLRDSVRQCSEKIDNHRCDDDFTINRRDHNDRSLASRRNFTRQSHVEGKEISRRRSNKYALFTTEN